MGIARNRSVTYENDSKGVELNYITVGSAIRKAVAGDIDAELFEDDWQKEIVEYYQKSVRQRNKRMDK